MKTLQGAADSTKLKRGSNNRQRVFCSEGRGFNRERGRIGTGTDSTNPKVEISEEHLSNATSSSEVKSTGSAPGSLDQEVQISNEELTKRMFSRDVLDSPKESGKTEEPVSTGTESDQQVQIGEDGHIDADPGSNGYSAIRIDPELDEKVSSNVTTPRRMADELASILVPWTKKSKLAKTLRRALKAGNPRFHRSNSHED